MRSDGQPITGKPPEEEMVVGYLPIIRRMAGSLMRRLPPNMRPDDLEAAGIIGLLQAAQQRDPERPERFEAYARRKIECAMLDELRRADILPKETRALSRRLVAAMAVVERRDGEIVEEAVAAELGVNMDEYRGMLERTVDVRLMSLDGPELLEEGNPSRRGYPQLESDSKNPLDSVLEAETCSRVAKFLKRLPERQRRVLALYYLEELSMKEISLTIGLSIARVCQLHSEGVHALRAMMEEEG